MPETETGHARRTLGPGAGRSRGPSGMTEMLESSGFVPMLALLPFVIPEGPPRRAAPGSTERRVTGAHWYAHE